MRPRGDRRSSGPFQRRELRLDALQGIVERAKAALSEDEHATFKAALETLSGTLPPRTREARNCAKATPNPTGRAVGSDAHSINTGLP